MYQKSLSSHLFRWLHTGLVICLVAAVVLSVLPTGLAQADAPDVVEPAKTNPAQKPLVNQAELYALGQSDDGPQKPESFLYSDRYTGNKHPAYVPEKDTPPDIFSSKKAVAFNENGDLPLPSGNSGGGLFSELDVRNFYPGITVDLTYDVVMGNLWEDRGETVIVNMGTDGYGAAVVDGEGFFWTPVWHSTDGYAMDLDCGMTISVVVGTDPAINITPPCLTGGIDILNDTANGSIAGDTGGTSLLLKVGYFNPELDEQQRLQAQPTQGGGISVSTLGDGSFSYDYASARQFNFGAETLIQVDYQVVGGHARTYLYPDTSVFMIQQYSIIGGYADIGQAVTATVIDMNTVTVVWSDTTIAYGPHGIYTFHDVPIEVGNSVEVALDGGPTLQTFAVGLGNLDFDTAADTLTGTAPDGADVRASLWQWVGLNHWYRNLHVLATSGDTFTMDFSTDHYIPVDLRARDDILVVVEDVNGNQVQVLSGPPFMSAYISLDSNLDCVYGRLYAPGLPIVVHLDKGGGEVYTRDTGVLTDVGNRLPHCYVIRDGEDNMVDFSTGDLVKLDNMGLGYTGSVMVVDFAWSGDTLNDDIIGSISVPIPGDIEVSVSKWQGEHYPAFGVETSQTSLTAGNFTTPFTVDIRDGVMIDFSLFDSTDGAVETNPWSYRPTLPYFELQLPFGVGGMAGSPGETVTAKLYDGATLLAETSDDWDDDPYRYWLDDFGEHSLTPGYRVEVSTSGGWSGDMVIPDLSIEGDVDTDMLTATGPDGLLYLDVYNNNEESPDGVGGFVPGSPAKWDVSLWGWDLLPSHWVSVTYQAVDGNRAYYGVSMAEISEVNLWLDYGARDWMWGNAEPGSTVTAVRDMVTLFTAFADPACGGCWGIDDPLDINPADVITVTAGAGVYPVTVEIPDPLTANADADTEVVSGQISGWLEEQVEVYGNWEDGYQEVETDTSGNYATDPYIDIPNGADGYIRFTNMSNWAYIHYHQYFREPSLIMDVNYGHDWIEGNYEPGHSVTLTVTESDGVTEKGTAEMVTGEIPWWGGGTGFSTGYGDPWTGEGPDILPGDWVFGEVDVEGTIYSNEVRIGTITGDVDVEGDSISGTVDAPWLPQDEEVQVRCHPWDAEGVEGKGDMVLPDGTDPYTCSWDPGTEWDVQPNQQIGVSYHDPGGYLDPGSNPVPGGNWVYNVFTGYSDELILNIHYDHNWIDGSYEPGHDIHLTVYDSGMAEKAHISIPTGPIDDWGGQSGFATYLADATWVPEQPDIQPGDVIHGEVDDGSAFTADVKVGLITGTPNVAADSVSGTVDADWLMLGPVDVACSIWEPDGREVYDSVDPDGLDPYSCVFDGDNNYDIVPGTNLMVSYFEPDGHQIFGDFSPPAPYLLIEKWFIGESPGVGGNAAFVVRYKNQGNSPAENVEIFDTMVGMTYLSDSSGFSISGVSGDSVVTWDLGTVEPSEDWNYFAVFGDVTGVLDGDISNTVEISTSDPFDQGEPWEKIGNWEGTVAANDTHLNVDKWSWTEYPAVGEQYVYTVNVCNDGSTSSSTVTLYDTLPTNTFYDTWWSSDVGWVYVDSSDHVLELEHPSISSWSCSEVYIMVTVDGGAQPGDGLYNLVSIAASNDMETEDNWGESYNEVGEDYVDLGIWQDFHWGTLVPGGYYRYGITFRNEGNIGVSEPIYVTATLPPGTSFAGWDSWDAATGISDPVMVGNDLTWQWQVGDLFPGSQGTIEVWVDILPGTGPGTPLDHLAEIDDVGEPYLENNTHILSEMVYDHGPNLRIHKYGWVEGDHIGYHLYVHNVGDEMVEDIWIYDYYSEFVDLDGGVENVHSNYEGFWEVFDHPDPIGGPPYPEKSQLTINLDELRPTWGADIWYTMVIPDPGAGTTFGNFAEIHPTTGDMWPEDNYASLVLGEGLNMIFLPLIVR